MWVFRRHLLPELLATIATPLTFLLVFGFGIGAFVREVQGVEYAVFVTPGLIGMTFVLSAFEDSVWSLWFHRQVEHTIDEYRVNPITTREIVLGKIFSGLTLGSIKGTVVAVIMILVTGISPTPLALAGYALVLFIGALSFSCFGTIFGTLFDRPEEIGRFYSIIVLPVVFFGGVFFPISLYPIWAQALVTFLPTTGIFEGGRAVLLTGQLNPQYLAIGLVWAVAAFFAAVAVFEHSMRE